MTLALWVVAIAFVLWDEKAPSMRVFLVALVAAALAAACSIAWLIWGVLRLLS